MKTQRNLVNSSFIIIFLSLNLSFASKICAQSKAKQLFSSYKSIVYQIRVIDIASDDKSSLGSGFLISDTGQIATNFHVVSSYIHEPKKYKLELVNHDDTTAELSLLSFDVIHDLAILQADIQSNRYLRLHTESLDKGDRIYSMGNPHDLGMTIVEGNYNGLVEKSRYKKILFSGSLNAGMSGGPAINERGKVIGINVSKGGEQISFLVPAENLKTLMQKIKSKSPTDDYDNYIQEALFQDQDEFYNSILNEPLSIEEFGDLKVPTKFSDSLKCWGHTVDEKEIKYYSVHQHCKSEDAIYIRRNMYTGEFFYHYEWTTTEELNQFQFYHALEKRFNHRNQGNAWKEDDISAYACHTDFINVANHTWKASSCFREYKKYRGLYDALLLMSTVDIKDRAAIIKSGATGISSSNAIKLFKNIMESIEWTE